MAPRVIQLNNSANYWKWWDPKSMFDFKSKSWKEIQQLVSSFTFYKWSWVFICFNTNKYPKSDLQIELSDLFSVKLNHKFYTVFSFPSYLLWDLMYKDTFTASKQTENTGRNIGRRKLEVLKIKPNEQFSGAKKKTTKNRANRKYPKAVS